MTTSDTICSGNSLDGEAAKRKLVVIAANPYSGWGARQRLVGELSESLRRRGLEPRVIWEPGQRRAVLSGPGLSQSCWCVVAAGGDGTVADVINEMPAGVPLATLPSGNENLFAREFGFTRDPEALAAAIAARTTRVIDLGRAGCRLFCLMVSAGFDAEVVHRLARWRDAAGPPKRVRRRTYVKPILDSLRNYAYDAVELEADGERFRGTHALVFNLPQYGFHLPFAPEALGDDGLLDWLLFERSGGGSLLRYAWAVARSRHRARPDVRHGRARRVRVTSDVPVPVQADGDVLGTTPVEIEVVERAIHVVVPLAAR